MTDEYLHYVRNPYVPRTMIRKAKVEAMCKHEGETLDLDFSQDWNDREEIFSEILDLINKLDVQEMTKGRAWIVPNDDNKTVKIYFESKDDLKLFEEKFFGV